MHSLHDGTSRIRDPFLARAVSLALRGRGITAPNPMVGCVIVAGSADGPVIVGEGFHPGTGQPHAEVFALRDAGERARGTHVYVTLEPCAHFGRTPPCAAALIEAGVEKVTIGMADPTSEAAGGARMLSEAGIEVEFASDPSPFVEMNRGWVKRVTTGVPYVTVKVGTSLDGRVACAPGTRSAMTGAAGAMVTQELRARSDAILIGAGTAIIDDPALTRRDSTGTLAADQPLRVVLASRTRLPHGLNLFTDGLAESAVLLGLLPDEPVPDWITALENADVSVLRYDSSQGLSGALRVMGERGVNDLLIEPGPRLLASLWRQAVIDELITVTAGGITGEQGVAMFAGSGSSEMDALDAVMAPSESSVVEDVVVTVWHPRLTSDSD